MSGAAGEAANPQRTAAIATLLEALAAPLVLGESYAVCSAAWLETLRAAASGEPVAVPKSIDVEPLLQPRSQPISAIDDLRELRRSEVSALGRQIARAAPRKDMRDSATVVPDPSTRMAPGGACFRFPRVVFLVQRTTRGLWVLSRHRTDSGPVPFTASPGR